MSQPVFLPRRAREVLLALHIAINGAWIGATVGILALELGKRGVDAGADRAAFLLHEWVVTWASYCVIATALAFSLFTVWGFFRYWWVLATWIVLTGLGGALAFWQTGAMAEVAALSDVAEATGLAPIGYEATTRALLASQLVALALLLALVLVSTLKPWGRTPWDRRRSEERRHGRWKLRTTFVLVTVGALASIAFVQMRALARVRATPAPAIDLESLADGVYRGRFDVLGYPVAVEAEILDGRFVRIDPLDRSGNRYARLARGIEVKILAAQRLDVDAVTGATTTSRALQLAAADALSRPPVTAP